MTDQTKLKSECLGHDIWVYRDVVPADLRQRTIDRYDAAEERGAPGSRYDNRECEYIQITGNTSWGDIDRAFVTIVRQILIQHYEEYDSLLSFNDEGYEVVCYEPGEVARLHCDGIFGVGNGPVRLWALVFYLNDCGDGGKTVFPRQNISVKPEAGMAALWPTHMTHPHKTLSASGKRYALITWSGFLKDQSNAQ